MVEISRVVELFQVLLVTLKQVKSMILENFRKIV